VAVAYRIGGRVPDRLLPRTHDGVLMPVRGRTREAVALVFPEAADRRWPDYLRSLADHATELAHWDGRVIAVEPIGVDGQDGEHALELTPELGDRLWVVRDHDGLLRPADADGASSTSGPAAAVVDRYGEIYHVWHRDDPEARPGPSPRQLEEWLRFLALQCPE
jgi:hypothetical protein